MDSGRAHRQAAAALSIAGHAAIVLLLTFSLPLQPSQRGSAGPTIVPIESVLIDEQAVTREMARLDEAERAEAARLEREAEEQRLELERLERARQEAERIALEEQQQREAEAERERIRLQQLEEERIAAEREAARIAEQERLEQERLAREAEEERRRQEAAEAARRAEEERLRREQEAREAELLAALAAEDEARRARESGLLDQYIRSIENKITQNWRRPASARPGVECVVIVTQIPGGDVTGVQIESCNGDAAVVRSVEAAVFSASPLPRPPSASLFERTLRLIFRPDD